MLKILQDRLQAPTVHALRSFRCKSWVWRWVFWRGSGARDQISNIHWNIEKAREFQKKHLLLHQWLSFLLSESSQSQFCLSFQRTSSWFYWFFSIFNLYFIYFSLWSLLFASFCWLYVLFVLLFLILLSGRLGCLFDIFLIFWGRSVSLQTLL